MNGVAVKQVQGANTIVDAMSATIIKQHDPGISGSAAMAAFVAM